MMLFFLVVLLPLILCHSQPDIRPTVNVEEVPVPEGGPDAFKSWIENNNRYKKLVDTITENEIVYVQFTVDTTGSLTDAVVVRGYEPIYDKEAIRLVMGCPIKWTPGKHKGEKVATTFTMPISFTEKTESISKIEERNKALILKANDELFNKGNLDYADLVFAEFYRDRGPDHIKEYIGALKAAFPDLTVSIYPIIAEGNVVAWRRDHWGTHQGEYMGFPPTGKEINWQSMIFSHMADSVIVHEWGSSNLNEVLHKNKIQDRQ